MRYAFFIAIKDYINNFKNFSFSDLIPFIVGIVIGFALCFLIYLLVFVISIKKDTKNINEIENSNAVKDEDISRIIENYKARYKDEVSSKKTNEKLTELKSMSWELINDIARNYYPNSQYPLLELSIEELISLDYYIMKKIEKIFSGKVLSKVKKMKLSSVAHILDMKKKYEKNKIVKASEKMKVKPIMKGFWTAINFLNPVYWVKKLMFDIPYNMIVNKISCTIIEVIGVETSNIYSKKAFVDDSEVNKAINEIEKMIGEDKND